MRQAGGVRLVCRAESAPAAVSLAAWLHAQHCPVLPCVSALERPRTLARSSRVPPGTAPPPPASPTPMSAHPVPCTQPPSCPCPAELLPPKERPKTSTAVARKLLSHALNMPGLRDKKAEQELAAQRKQAREARRAAQEASKSVWGDD